MRSQQAKVPGPQVQREPEAGSNLQAHEFCVDMILPRRDRGRRSECECSGSDHRLRDRQIVDVRQKVRKEINSFERNFEIILAGKIITPVKFNGLRAVVRLGTAIILFLDCFETRARRSEDLFRTGAEVRRIVLRSCQQKSRQQKQKFLE